YRFLAPFSQFSRKFPGSCEERAVLSGNSGRFRDYSGRFGKLFKSLENSLGLKAHGGSNPSASARALEHYVPRLFSFLSLGHRFNAVA
ncbi:MAG: hypothetical protein J6K14_09690, partial [Clostridia bacterium]|nr:hypothetical protein [Clostridia bacterium]